MYSANASIGVIRNVVYEKTGKMFSRNNMAYISGLCNELKEINNIEALSSSDKMVKYLNDNGFDYMILLHDPIISAVVNDSHLQNLSSEHNVIDFPLNEQTQVNEFVDVSREAFTCLPKQFLLMGI